MYLSKNLKTRRSQNDIWMIFICQELCCFAIMIFPSRMISKGQRKKEGPCRRDEQFLRIQISATWSIVKVRGSDLRFWGGGEVKMFRWLNKKWMIFFFAYNNHLPFQKSIYRPVDSGREFLRIWILISATWSIVTVRKMIWYLIRRGQDVVIEQAVKHWVIKM